MTSEKIERPGEKVTTTLAELLNVSESNPEVAEWQQQMRDIEAAERSAESESSSIRIR